MSVLHAQLEQPTRLRLVFAESPEALSPADIIVTPLIAVREMQVEGMDLLLTTEPFDLGKEYTVLVRRRGIVPVDIGPCLEMLRPTARLGCTLEDGNHIFRIFAPRATAVRLYLFEHPEQSVGTEYFLSPGEAGVWEISLRCKDSERYYAYRIDGPRGIGEMFNSQIPIADPYATAVVTANVWRHPARSVLPGHIPGYDWEGDTHVTVDPSDLVVYEMHVRDMTAHASSGIAGGKAGTYRGLVQEGKRGGISHIRNLGVNAVELMPCQHFASIELPYHRHVSDGMYNYWNPYERNHWGYMTSYFFAPEPRYSEQANNLDGTWNLAAPAHVNEFRDMVKAFHRAGIAVIMDVVYNHTSQYDYQPLKYIDRKYYYRRAPNGTFLEESGCGNDFATEMPMARRLIVDSIMHWITEYHIDGFRFDLAAMIDRETLAEVRKAAQAVHPGVLLIAEPWGGGRYDLKSFSELGYSAWNDIFRNGVKGSDAMRARGYLFGSWGTSEPEDFGKWMLGSTVEKNGPFRSSAHAVNYLESHDDYTLGDFIRIATGTARPGQPIRDMEEHVRLTAEQLRIARMAAVILLTAQGAVMLHAGQEFARSKVIADRGLADTRPGTLDHNSYEKDDETNWLNYSHAEWNRELVAYYRGLIALRKAHRSLRRAPIGHYRFLAADVGIAGGFELKGMDGEPDLIVLINGNSGEAARYPLPEGRRWGVMVDAHAAGTDAMRHVESDHIVVEPGCCFVLVAEN